MNVYTYKIILLCRLVLMKKIYIVLLLVVSALLFAGCWSQIEDVVVSPWSDSMYNTSYVIAPLASSSITIYWTVVADTIKTISSNKGGVLSYIDCQPGKEVTKNTVIAKIQANTADSNYQNGKIQLQNMKDQLNNIKQIYALTQDALSLQKNIVYEQYQNNLTLLDNLQQSQSYTDSSLEYQEKLLDQQYTTIKESKFIDLDKMQTSIANAYKQYLILIKDALKKIDDVYSHDFFSLSDKDTDLKNHVITEHARLKNKVSNTMNSSQFSQYLLDMSELMLLAARGVQATTATTILPQSSSVWGMSIDTLSTAFTTLASTFIGSKSAFDTLVSSYDSVKNTYNSQLKSADLNTDNFTENTAKSTALQLENQKASLKLAQKSLLTQIDSSDSNERIQLMNLKNQIMTIEQNIAVLSHSLDGETLYAGVDWIIKTKMVGEDNKVAPGTPLCQITPKDENNMSIQVFSYQRLALWTRGTVSNQEGNFLATWILQYEYPYRDVATQNYIYEIPVVRAAVKENERVIISLLQAVNNEEVRIPFSYVSPRLEWYLVRAKTVKNTIKNVYIQLWPINAWYVQVLSWLNLWNEIVQ